MLNDCTITLSRLYIIMHETTESSFKPFLQHEDSSILYGGYGKMDEDILSATMRRLQKEPTSLFEASAMGDRKRVLWLYNYTCIGTSPHYHNNTIHDNPHYHYNRLFMRLKFVRFGQKMAICGFYLCMALHGIWLSLLLIYIMRIIIIVQFQFYSDTSSYIRHRS